MFCPNCGAQNPDESMFCAQCGEKFGEQLKQSQPVEEPVPVQPEQPVQQESQQVTYAGQPNLQQTYVQPQQPQQFSGQPMYAAQPYPQQAKIRTPMSPEKKKKITIVSVCGAVVAAFLIVLFTAIIPNSGFKGKLRHVWKVEDRYSSGVLDLKSKMITEDGESGMITDWHVQGNHLFITSMSNMRSYTVDYICAMTPDGRTLYLFEADGYTAYDDPDVTLTRID